MNRYLLWLASLTLSFAALVAGFCWLIDPYDVWGQPRRSFNQAKPFVAQHLLAAKHAQYRRADYRTLIAGNSRSEVGIDPRSPAWPKAWLPAYNFGLPGMALGDSVEAAIAAAEIRRPERIILGVEFLDFRVSAQDWAEAPQTPRAKLDRISAREQAEMLFSLDAVTQSVQTILAQHQRFPATTTPQGFNGLNDYHAVVAAEGHAAIFAQRNAEYAARFTAPVPRALRWPGAGRNRSWEALARLADYCKAHGITLMLHSYPYHVDLLMLFARSGQLDDLAIWRGDLARFAAQRQLVLVDAIGVNPRTTKAVPRPESRTPMRDYWEAGHFKPALGDALIGALAAPPRAVDPAQLAAQLSTYEAANPSAAARIAALVTAQR